MQEAPGDMFTCKNNKQYVLYKVFSRQYDSEVPEKMAYSL